ncbi:DNA polymerase I [bioreactor metagenome]|uniref:DNA-directed DNA polymerase n=1 Tax=bioreactor metagenome TaxID=1076179 RepID=A0A644X574_9ZZZZ
MNEKKPVLFLLDAMALAYRAYYAMIKNPVRNSKGLNTSAILGFANTILDLINKEKPHLLGVAFDTIAPTARHDEFAFYKANREPMPDDLSIALPYIKEMLQLMDIPILEVDGYEADDVIGTLAKEAETRGYQTYMMTPDKDFGQLVSENIFMYKPAKFGAAPEVWGVREVCDRFSIEQPEQVIDILAIMGDSADNIPGIFGIGEVGAKKLLSEFGTVENLLAHADDIKNPTMKQKVLAGKESALVSKQLATIITDVPIQFMPSRLEWKVPAFAPLQKFFEEMEFKTFAKRWWDAMGIMAEKQPAVTQGQSTLFDQDFVEARAGLDSIISNINSTEHEYSLIDNVSSLDLLVNELQKAKSFCFDTETDSLDTLIAKLAGIAICINPGKAYFVYTKDDEFRKTALEKMKPVFENENIIKIGQNLKYDIAVLRTHGVNVKGEPADTMLAHYLLQPELRHNLDYLSETYLNYKTITYEEITGSGKQKISIFNVTPEKLKDYSCEDADVTLKLWEILEPQLDTYGMSELFHEIETPLIEVLEDMERSGIRIDPVSLKEFSLTLGKEILTLESEIHQLAGQPFNIASPKQLGEILFDKLQIAEKPKKTQTKQYSTSEEVLLKYVTRHPIVAKVLEYRGLTKLQNTYVDALPQLIHPETGRVHTSYNQAVTATGRLSSTNPNLQNIPIRTELGQEIRKAFVPRDENHVLISADYSQIELRIIASISEDEHMVDAFRKGIDIHTATAAKVYGVQLNEVKPEQRRHAKTVNFGIIYGISAFGLSERLGISRKDAADIIENYFEQFPGIKKYMDDTILFARANGYVETLKHRRRYLKDIHSTNSFVRGFAERNAINAPIQGSSADMIKLAMIDIHAWLKKSNLKTKMILQVHDELVFDVPKDEIEIVKPEIERLMKSALPLKVPVEVEVKDGKNWLEAH